MSAVPTRGRAAAGVPAGAAAATFPGAPPDLSGAPPEAGGARAQHRRPPLVARDVSSFTGSRNDRIQVIERAADVMWRVAGARDGLTAAELGECLRLPRSTAYRIVRALVREGFVRVDDVGKVRLGPSLAGLAHAGRPDLGHETRSVAHRLAVQAREAVELAVLERDEAVVVEHWDSTQTLRFVGSVGDRLPLHCTAHGKALLATLPQGHVAASLPQELAAFTPRTVVDRDRVVEEVEAVRSRGLAYDRDEFSEGVSSVATTVADGAGHVIAVAVIAPTARFLAGEQELAARLLATRRQVLEIFGEAPATG
jgi:IclR family transcriptional regulator, acetate operon repressor